MHIALVGAELEENLGLRYIASSLENRGHSTSIVPYNSGETLPAPSRKFGDASRRSLAFP